MQLARLRSIALALSLAALAANTSAAETDPSCAVQSCPRSGNLACICFRGGVFYKAVAQCVDVACADVDTDAPDEAKKIVEALCGS
uniref:Dual O-methyltransferase/FAD-dependent monooxygenase CTB3 (Cercosporin toxin biosynthesis cluster protein 3) n=1 Tax=Ganoderma boninense TaxID=34458 RepID=A0A5K1K1Z7_9APHY|nr:Dual O-methyltransferase/FAD-dependent monooxygenase CTB3 (Cercosporin toxin biosynthesis cluster protein 3) [Includes: O-methyltransferase (EC, FAD-dependent monooxygenase (EC ] [Ganoderma boninense]